MKKPTYIDFVTEAVTATPYGTPICTVHIADNLAQAFHLETAKARKLTNVYLKRLADRGAIARLKKGVYGKAKMTVFGAAVPAREEMIMNTFLYQGSETIGYETGAAFLNRVGLSTLLPKKRQVATNRHRAIIPAGTGIELKRPLAPVTTKNAPYLQMLEMLRDRKHYSIDAQNPEALIQTVIIEHGLDQTELIKYANAYLKAEELQDVVGVIFGRLDEHEAA